MRLEGWNGRLALAGLICAVLLGSMSPALLPSSAQRERTEPASDGRPITPAGSLIIDATTRQAAVGALPVSFVRSPEGYGKGRYLIVVNSGFGIQFNAASNKGQQSLAVIDLEARPAPAVIQNVYFPSPQSVNVGVVFSPKADADGSYSLYVSGGFENKIWVFSFRPGVRRPITPTTLGSSPALVPSSTAVSAFTNSAPSPRYNDNNAPVYPAGLAISPDGDTLFIVNNLADSLGIVRNLRGLRKLERVDLRPSMNREHFVYPYAVVAWPGIDSNKLPRQPDLNSQAPVVKLFVSCWNDASIAVIDPARPGAPITYIKVGQHPTAMLLNDARNRLLVVNSNDDSVSVIDPVSNKEIERINVRLAENALPGNTPEGLALSSRTLYIANAHSNSVAV